MHIVAIWWRASHSSLMNDEALAPLSKYSMSPKLVGPWRINSSSLISAGEKDRNAGFHPILKPKPTFPAMKLHIDAIGTPSKVTSMNSARPSEANPETAARKKASSSGRERKDDPSSPFHPMCSSDRNDSTASAVAPASRCQRQATCPRSRRRRSLRSISRIRAANVFSPKCAAQSAITKTARGSSLPILGACVLASAAMPTGSNNGPSPRTNGSSIALQCGSDVRTNCSNACSACTACSRSSKRPERSE